MKVVYHTPPNALTEVLKHENSNQVATLVDLLFPKDLRAKACEVAAGVNPEPSVGLVKAGFNSVDVYNSSADFNKLYEKYLKNKYPNFVSKIRTITQDVNNWALSSFEPEYNLILSYNNGILYIPHNLQEVDYLIGDEIDKNSMRRIRKLLYSFHSRLRPNGKCIIHGEKTHEIVDLTSNSEFQRADLVMNDNGICIYDILTK